VPPLAFAIFGALTPGMAKRLGLERLAWLAMLLTAVSGTGRVLAENAALFVLLSSLAYAGMGIGNVALSALVRRHFPDRIGVVSSGYVLLVSVGTAIPAFTAVPIADLAGWRMSTAVWALVALAAVVPWLVVDRTGARRDRIVDEEPVGRYIPVVALIRSRLAWGLVGVFGINSLNAYAMFAWLPTILTESGVSAYASGVYLTLFALIAIPAALVVPWLAVRVSNPMPLVVLFASCYALGYVGLLVAPTTATPVWVIAAGFGPGAFPLTLTLINLRSETVSGAAALAGFTQGLGYAIAGLGPFVVGVLREIQGGWEAPLAFLLGGLVIQVMAGVAVVRGGTIEEQLQRSRSRPSPPPPSVRDTPAPAGRASR
jgi:CP family cyanate transporter-like MFS transporter